MFIRSETESDADAIDAVHEAAFAGGEGRPKPIEVGLVRALRADSAWIPALSLVADRHDGGVVGHVVCSLGFVGETPALGLGPLGVLPPHQRSGVGSALMHAVLGAADALDYPAVILLGHVDYYPAFGFVPARTLGITPGIPTWGDAFQARTLASWAPSIRGAFRYAAPFDDL